MKGLKIQIVEDEVLTADLLRRRLQKLGHDIVEISSNGVEAIDTARSEKPDVIIMDINLLGDMNGIEVAKKISSFHDFYLIFLSGYDSEEYREKANDLDPEGYIIKPANFNDLEKILNGISKKKFI